MPGLSRENRNYNRGDQHRLRFAFTRGKKLIQAGEDPKSSTGPAATIPPFPANMRCYFHLTKGGETIRDESGIEVMNLDHARAAALKAITEMRASDPKRADEGTGWTLTVVDAAGAVLFTIPLDSGLAN